MRIYPEFVFKLNKIGQAPEKLGEFLEAASFLGYIPVVPASGALCGSWDVKGYIEEFVHAAKNRLGY